MNVSSTPQPLVWDIESTHPELLEPLKTALREVTDPEIGMNIIQLGLVRNVQIQDEMLILHMIMTTPFCPYAPTLLENSKEKAETVSPYPVSISFGMEPWDFSMMEDPTAFDWGLYQ